MKNALIIDDEKDFCLLLKGFLERKGYRVYTAHDLKDGFSVLENNSISMLFLDNNLPDGFGWQHAAGISDKYKVKSMHLISAHKTDLSTYRIPLGVNIIEKPFNFSLLEEVMKNVGS